MKNQFTHYEFLKTFGNLPKSAVYLIFGEDDYLREKVEKAILKFYSETNELDKAVLYGDETNATFVLEELEMLPFISENRLVILKNFEQLKPKDQKRIQEYCEKPFDSSILLIVSQKPDLKTATLKKIGEIAISVSCKKPYNASDLLRWLNSELRIRNLRMEQKAMNLFVNSIELNYNIAANELEKLMLFTKNSPIISYEAVLACVGKSSVKNIFDLQNALGQKNLKLSLKILQNMLENQESGIFIISMLTRFFLLVLKIKSLRKQNIGDNEIIAKHMWEIFRNYRKNYLEAANHFNRDELRKIFFALLQADTALKSREAKLEKIIMTTLMFEICGKGI
ncbi:MAG: DNA polymerase III subunit delta [Candidatus Cloacimonas sp. 4484_275]|nr:MAG: DNA polymerase III subunit delta [Candidatus Cloacimonas sp. 4484_275]